MEFLPYPCRVSELALAGGPRHTPMSVSFVFLTCTLMDFPGEPCSIPGRIRFSSDLVSLQKLADVPELSPLITCVEFFS